MMRTHREKLQGVLRAYDAVPDPVWRAGESFFLRSYLFIFRDSRREGEREGEKHQCVVASHMPPTRDPAHNPGMCPDWD